MRGTGRRAGDGNDAADDLVDRLGALVLPADDDDVDAPVAPEPIEVAP